MADTSDLVEFHFGDEDRKLGTLPETPEELSKRHTFRVFGENTASDPGATPSLILPANYAPTWQQEGDNNDKFNNGIGDQDGQGACGCISGAELCEAILFKSGIPGVKLSWGQLYWSLNGGRDQGTYSGDVLKRLSTQGIASTKVCPIDTRSSHKGNPAIEADMLNYIADEFFLTPTIGHVVSANMQGFEVHSSMWWYDSDNVDSNGWLSDNPRGRKGGHSIRQTEFIIEGSRQGFRFPNTWTAKWGVKGYGKISAGRLAETLKVWPFFAVRSMRQKDGTFPAPKPLSV